MKTVICSHGFGVKADSRGMFPDFAAHLPGYEFVMFDYCDILPNGDTVVYALEDQAARLQHHIDTAPEGSILLAHSQGCIIAALADTARLSRVILLTPPVTMSMQRVINILKERSGARFDPQGTSLLPRADGTITHITREYLESIERHHPLTLYASLAERLPTLIVRATRDELLGDTDFSSVSGARLIEIPSDHNFTGTYRHDIITLLQAEL